VFSKSIFLPIRYYAYIMGTTSKAVSVILRVGELICAAIVVGILGRYLDLVYDANASPNGRIIYTIVIGGISIFFSLVLMPPLKYSFWAFGLDFALFICWMVAFGLLINVSISISPPSRMGGRQADVITV
jgi:hypothetical protein